MSSCPDGFVCINNFHMIYISFISLKILYLVINQYYKDIHEKIYNLKREISNKKQELDTRTSDNSNQFSANKELELIKQKEKELNKYQKKLEKLSEKTQRSIDYIQEDRSRDRAVIEDPLYPPLKRNYNMHDIERYTNKYSNKSLQVIIKSGIIHKNSNTDKSLDKPGNNDENVVLALFEKDFIKDQQTGYIILPAERNNIKIPIFIDL